MLKNHGSEFRKIAGKKISTKFAEATGDLTRSKISDKITSFKSKPESKRFPRKTIESERFPEE